MVLDELTHADMVPTSLALDLDFSALRNDLAEAWDFRTEMAESAMDRLAARTNYVYCIDPKSMCLLKCLMSKTPFNYSLVALADDVRSGMPLDAIIVDNNPLEKRVRKARA